MEQRHRHLPCEIIAVQRGIHSAKVVAIVLNGTPGRPVEVTDRATVVSPRPWVVMFWLSKSVNDAQNAIVREGFRRALHSIGDEPCFFLTIPRTRGADTATSTGQSPISRGVRR